MGKSQQTTFQALKQIRERAIIDWKGLDSDNGSEFIDAKLDGLYHTYEEKGR